MRRRENPHCRLQVNRTERWRAGAFAGPPGRGPAQSLIHEISQAARLRIEPERGCGDGRIRTADGR